MSTLNLNAELFRELSYIADDENSMKKLLKYVKKLAAQQYKAPEPAVSVASEDAEPYRPKTKAELIDDLNEVCEEIKLIRAEKLKGQTWEDSSMNYTIKLYPTFKKQFKHLFKRYKSLESYSPKRKRLSHRPVIRQKGLPLPPNKNRR